MKRLNIRNLAAGMLALLWAPLLAQQNPMYTQYMFNTMALNPAYAGSRNVISATALHRSQWSGIEGAPKTTTFTIDAPLNQKRIGLGFQLFNDELGITHTTGAAISYAYRLRLAQGTLALGIQGNGVQYRADLTSVPLGSSSAYDPAFAENINKFLLNFGTGVYYNTDRFYLGLSAQDLLNNQLNDYESDAEDAPSNTRSMHLFLATGYVFPLDDEFKLKPSVLIKGVRGAPLEADINATLWIRDIVAVGAQYRTSADVAALFEIQASPQFRIGYSYDHSTTRLKSLNSGSHEIMLRYEFGFERGKILSPRYF